MFLPVILFFRSTLNQRIFTASRRRVTRDKIDADRGEQDTDGVAQCQRFVQKKQAEDGATYDEHAVDWDDDAGWSLDKARK